MIPLKTDDRDPRVPVLSIVFGYGAMVPLVVAAAAAWLAPLPWPMVATSLGILWGGGILMFLAGVRRGLAFRTAGGERPAQMVVMLWLFTAGLASFLFRTAPGALTLLIAGYASIALLDPIAARRGEAPAHFARLRPGQMAVAVAALAVLLAWHLAHD